ncbi:MAG TPA: MarR family transcriptional regulator [Gemmatimonadaceae bacterium]|nr:MarR family transcriptional regulator [Gemmatimonadaceae bacterium]
MAHRAPDHIDRIVAEWRRERPELDTAPLAIVGRLFRLTALANGELSPDLADLGLQPGWFDLLAALRRAGAPYERNPTELLGTVLLTSGGMTKRLDRMVEAGLVERRPDPNDRRGTLVRLTRQGKETIDRAVELHLANEARILRVLSAKERRELDGLLRRLLAAVDPIDE